MTPFCVNLLEANLFCSKILFDLNFDNISRLLFNSYLVIVLAVTPLILGLPRSMDMDLASFTKGLFLLFGIFTSIKMIFSVLILSGCQLLSAAWDESPLSSDLFVTATKHIPHPASVATTQPLVSFEAVSEGEAAVMTAAQY